MTPWHGLVLDGAPAATNGTAGANLVAFDAFLNQTGGTANGTTVYTAEIIIYNKVLTTNERPAVTSYLSHRYSIPV